MIIKGVSGGNPVEFTPEEKPAMAVLTHVPHLAPENQTWWATKVEITKSNHISNGKQLRGMFANNSYVAEGTFMLRSCDMDRHDTNKPVAKSFMIKFEDSLDKVGMPDLKITEFQFT